LRDRNTLQTYRRAARRNGNLVIEPKFWAGRRVFLTGHTGFKGAWMALLLRHLGAHVTGFALPPLDPKDLFAVADGERAVETHVIADIREEQPVAGAMQAARPEIVIHMAAQSLVRPSYEEPVRTYATNVMGTVHLLEAARRTAGVRAVVVVTSDKCYENLGWVWGYRENDRLGGHDPYSNSKACTELVTEAYRSSFFGPQSTCQVASVRAGNVIGGGDWARDRLVPDAMRAFMAKIPLRIRNPAAVRPWQHVLDPVVAYLLLAQRLFEHGRPFAESFNFGPSAASEVPVSRIVETLVRLWGDGARWEQDAGEHPHEAAYLKLDCAKAAAHLGWRPLIGLDEALELTVEWYRGLAAGADMRDVTLAQMRRVLGV
jgi:CDP-glucose 4,6-dehydratase